MLAWASSGVRGARDRGGSRRPGQDRPFADAAQAGGSRLADDARRGIPRSARAAKAMVGWCARGGTGRRDPLSWYAGRTSRASSQPRRRRRPSRSAPRPRHLLPRRLYRLRRRKPSRPRRRPQRRSASRDARPGSLTPHRHGQHGRRRRNGTSATHHQHPATGRRTTSTNAARPSSRSRSRAPTRRVSP